MADENKKIICPSCGFQNSAPLANDRCVSCGSRIDDMSSNVAMQGSRYQQQTFSMTWFGIAIGVMGALTGAIVFGLPRVVPLFDFEGYAGMMMAIPVWSIGGALVGLISPGRTFTEPVAGAFLIALPTAFLLFDAQTVKLMPGFMYVLFSALGLLFTLVGAYVGERIQMGPEPD